MKVILNEKVKKLGEKGDLVNTSEGYESNFLIPRGLAEEATPAKIKEWEQKHKAAKKKEEQKQQNAESLRKHLQDKKIVIKSSAGDSGKLFGSITSAQVAHALKQKFDIDVDKKEIKLPETIRNTGDYVFQVRLYQGVEATMTLTVEGE
jgi:large subunit ribosomal protein L9